jgi:predicted ester cyclase
LLQRTGTTSVQARDWNRDQYREAWSGARVAFADMRVTIEDLVAEGDEVAGWATFRGTHQGPFWGIAPTGKPVRNRLFFVQRIVHGEIVDNWGMVEMAAILQQLGVLAAPASTT